MKRTMLSALLWVAAIPGLFEACQAQVAYLTDGGPFGTLTGPRSVAVDGRGNGYVLDLNGVHVFDRAGRHVGMFGKGGRAVFRQGSAHAIAVSKTRLFVADRRGIRYEYDLDGRPCSLAKLGGRFFLDNLGRSYIYDPETRQVSGYGVNMELASGINENPNHLVDPRAAVARPNGFLYVADGVAHRVLSFDGKGRHVDRLRSQFQNPRGLALSGDLLFVLDDLSDQIDAAFVKVFDGDDRLIAEFGQPGAYAPPAGRVDFASSIAANEEFLLVCDQVANRVVRIPRAAFLPGKHEPGVVYHRAQEERLTRSDTKYSIRIGGTLGISNTSRVEAVSLGATRTPRFQPNVSVTIANAGNVAIANPRIVVNGGPNWFSGKDMAQEIVRGCRTDEEKAVACWNFVRRQMRPGISWPDYFLDGHKSVTRFFNAFGSGACGSYHWLLPRIAMLAGLKATSGQLSDGSHGVAQIEYGGKGHYFDSLLSHNQDPRTLIGLFFPKLDNRTIASYEDLVHDHYLMKRTGEFVGWLAREFGYHDGWAKFTMDYQDPANMGMLLRPGESIARRWSFLGQYVGKDEPDDAITNGEVVYRPLLADGSYRAFVVREEKMACTADDGISPALHVAKNNSMDGTTVFKVSSPYPIVGGYVSGVFKRTGENDQLRLDASYDGNTWFPLSRFPNLGTRRETIGFSHLEGLRRQPLHYEIYIRIEIATTGPLSWVGVDDLGIQVTFQSYSPSLPALDVGANEVRYIDDTSEPHEVTIEHRWKESGSVAPPGASPAPVFPPDGTTHHGFDFVFKWQPALTAKSSIDDYEFLLSARKDMAWPLAPNFETFARSSTPELRVPEPSYFLPGTTYYWKVRAVDERGVRGPWSNVWSFQVDGPSRPLGLKQQVNGNRIQVSWEPNPEGTKPVRYEVYASDERGFTPSDRPYPATDLDPDRDGKYPIRPANLLASTSDTSMVVVDEGNRNSLANKCFYRVRAIDAAGVRSAPAEYLEVDHPFIYSTPETGAKVGTTYSYQVKTTWSMGDAQWNRVPPKPQGVSFLFADHLVFKLVKAPGWLSIDKSKGLLSGTPPSDAAGSHEVSVEVTAFDTSPDDEPKVRSKSAQHFVLTVSP